jgi:hypothetical protein
MSENVDPSITHPHWIALVQDEFGVQVRIINNNNKTLPKVNLL